MRCFLALLPDTTAREACLTLQSALGLPDASAVPAANLHITLVFLGHCSSGQLESLSRLCDHLPACGEFSLEIGRAGWWQKPQIAWLAPVSPPAALLQLEHRLRELATAAGIEPEQRPYRPHITLLRKVRHEPDLPDVAAFTWPVRDFCLMQSLSTRSGVVYRVLQRWSLQ